MVLTRKDITALRRYWRVPIEEDLERLLLDRFGTDPDPYEYTEQDITEQSRKIIHDYYAAKGIFL